ncbi:MAG: hypothetical protein AAFN74_17450 [Myxococcota bacterium]
MHALAGVSGIGVVFVLVADILPSLVAVSMGVPLLMATASHMLHYPRLVSDD